MSNELYFIPILAEALRQPARSALREAFERIVELGQEERYGMGHGPFLRFMACSMAQWSADSFGAPDDPARRAFESSRPCRLRLDGDGKRIAAWTLVHFPFRAAVAGVQPGRYQLTLDTGWVLWEEELRPTDLLFTRAFPHEALPLAAQTGEVMFPVTREYSVMDAALRIGVRPGLEGGALELLLPGRSDTP